MQFGTRFSLVAMSDPAAPRALAQALDQAGFRYVLLGGHLLSAEPGRFPDRPEPTYVGPFHEPFVLFAYLAAATERLEFWNGVLILPLFPTALVAKQAAELSLLSGGRFQLGVGVSWNPAEYQALDQDIHARGARIEEQIAVLRKLWTEPFVSFEGAYHHFDRVGLNRLPPAPIPIWMGSGTDDRVLRRVARVADGWQPMVDPTEPMTRLRRFLEEAGRDPATFKVAGRLTAGPEGKSAWVEAVRAQQAIGVTHVTIAAPADMEPAAALERTIEARRALVEEFGES
jgi:probable F420-dependent oxidoreductase